MRAAAVPLLVLTFMLLMAMREPSETTSDGESPRIMLERSVHTLITPERSVAYRSFHFFNSSMEDTAR